MYRLKTIVPEELPLLREIAIETFRDTFAADNTPENMAAYLATGFAPEFLARELATPKTEWYLVWVDDVPAGHLKLNLSRTPPETGRQPGLEIERIYVRTPFQGRGIGRFMMDFAFKRAEETHAPMVWLGVWEHNQRALAFYRSLGFETIGSHIFQLGHDAQTDLLMMKEC